MKKAASIPLLVRAFALFQATNLSIVATTSPGHTLSPEPPRFALEVLDRAKCPPYTARVTLPRSGAIRERVKFLQEQIVRIRAANQVFLGDGPHSPADVVAHQRREETLRNILDEPARLSTRLKAAYEEDNS